MYTALYRTERPEVFSEVLGQEPIVKILSNQIATGTVGHAYLFCGTRGTGKTTMARLLAKAVNCLGTGEKPCGTCANCRAIQEGRFIDLIELDAASHRGIENVRELRESVSYPPAVGERKVYIIDEVHMLTKEALNALLKTLEEPPERVMFILCTTNPEQLLSTVLSRVMRFDFRRIPRKLIAHHLGEICEKRKVQASEEALSLLAANADGSVRDGLSLLDRCLSGRPESLDRDAVLDYLGAVSDAFYTRMTDSLFHHDVEQALLLLDRAIEEGKDVRQLLSGLLIHYRSLLIAKYVDRPEDLLNLSRENVDQIRRQAESLPLSVIKRAIVTVAETIRESTYSSQARILMEIMLVTLAAEEGGGSGPTKEAPDHAEERDSLPPTSGQTKKAPATLLSLKEESMLATEKDNLSAEKSVAAPEKESPLTKEPMPATEGGEVKTEKPEQATGQTAETEGKLALEPEKLKDEEDPNALWTQILDTLEPSGSDYLIRQNTRLVQVSARDIQILCDNRISLALVEKKRKEITEAARSLTGLARKLVIRAEGDKEEADRSQGKKAENVEAAAKNIEEVFGKKPRIV